MNTREESSSPQLNSIPLTVFNITTNIHNTAFSIAQNNVEGFLPRCLINHNILAMSVANEIANNPGLTLTEVSFNVGKDFLVDYALTRMLSVGNGNRFYLSLLAFNIAADCGEHIDIDKYNQCVTSYLSLMKPDGNLSEDFQGDLYLDQLDRMESASFMPYLLKGASVCRNKLGKWAKDFAEMIDDKTANIREILTTKTNQFQEILSKHGIELPPKGKNPYAEEAFQLRNILPATALAMKCHLDMAKATNESLIDAIPNSTEEIVFSASDKAITSISDLFKNIFHAANKELIHDLGNLESKELLLAESKVNNMHSCYQQCEDNLNFGTNKLHHQKPNENVSTNNVKLSIKSEFRTLSDEFVHIGSAIAEFMYQRAKLKQDENKFEAGKLKIIENIELKIKESGLELDEMRKQRYTNNDSIRFGSLSELRQHVYSMMKEDLTLDIIKRKEKFKQIQQEITHVKGQINALTNSIERYSRSLQSVILQQIGIQRKIESITLNTIPAEMQTGIKILQCLIAKSHPAAAAAMQGVSYFIELLHIKEQEKAQHKINGLKQRFDEYQSTADTFNKSLKEAGNRIQNNHTTKAYLNFELLNNSYGTPQLTIIENLLVDFRNDLNSNLSRQEQLFREREKLNTARRNKNSEINNATGKEKEKLELEKAGIKSQLSRNKMELYDLGQNINDNQTTISDLEKLYEQQKPIANMLDWFDKYHANFYKGLNQNEIAARTLWQKTVKEQLAKINLLHAELDAGVNNLATELLAMIPLFERIHPKLAKYFGKGIFTLQHSYNIYRIGEQLYDTLRVLNEGRFIKNGDELISTMSLVGAIKNMGLGFKFGMIADVLKMVTFAARIFDAIFNWNIFKDPTHELIKNISQQLHERIKNLSEQITQLSQQVADLSYKLEMNHIENRQSQTENSNQHLNTQHRIDNNDIALKKSNEEQRYNNIEEKIKSIIKNLSKVEKATNISSIKNIFVYYHSIVTNEACIPQFNEVVMTDGSIISPLDAIDYLRRELQILDNSFKNIIQLPNYYITCFVLENIAKLIDENENPSDIALINNIVTTGELLYQFIYTLSHSKVWIQKITDNIIDDLKYMERIIDDFDPYKELPHDAKTINNNTEFAELSLRNERKTSLNTLTARLKAYKLYYYPKYIKGRMLPIDLPTTYFETSYRPPLNPQYVEVKYPKNVTTNSIIITEVTDSHRVEVRLADNATKTLLPAKLVLIDNEEKEFLKKITKHKKNELIGEYTKPDDRYKKLMDRLYASRDSFTEHYYFLIKLILRDDLKLPNKFYFELDKEQQKVIIDKLQLNKIDGCDDLAQTFSNIPTALVFNYDNNLTPLLLPKVLIDEVGDDPENIKLSKMASQGLIQSQVKYIIEQNDSSYFFTILYMFEKDKIVLGPLKKIIYEFDRNEVESKKYFNINEFLIHKLYGGVLKNDKIPAINLFKFSAKFPSLPFKYNSNQFSPLIATALNNMTEQGLITNALHPFFQLKYARVRCDNWLSTTFHINNLYRNRSQQLKNIYLRSDTQQIVSRTVKNYELLIGCLRLLYDIDYSTTVTLVKEELHLPDMKRIDVLLNSDIESLRYFLQRIIRQHNKHESQIFDALFRRIGFITNNYDLHLQRLATLLCIIKAKVTENAISACTLERYPSITVSILANNYKDELDKIKSYRDSLSSKTERSSYHPLTCLPSAMSDTAEEQRSNSLTFSELKPKLILFTDHYLTRTLSANHHYNFLNMRSNLPSQDGITESIVIKCCLREQIVQKFINIQRNRFHPTKLFVFAVLNHFHWCMLAVYVENELKTKILWKDNYANSHLEPDEIKMLTYYQNQFDTRRKVDIVKASSKFDLWGKIHHTGPVVIQEINDVIKTYRQGKYTSQSFSLDKVDFTFKNDTNNNYTELLNNVLLKHCHTYGRFDVKETDLINNAMHSLISTYYDELLNEICNPLSNISLLTIQIFADNLLKLLWDGASYSDKKTYELAHEQTIIYPKQTNSISTPKCQFRAIAKQLIIVDKKLFNKYASESLAATNKKSLDGLYFFKSPYSQLGVVQAALRSKTAEYIRNYPKDIFSTVDELEASAVYLDKMEKKDYIGDHYTLQALSNLLGLTIIVACNDVTEGWKIDTYPKIITEDLNYQKSSIIIIQHSPTDFEASGCNLNNDIVQAIQMKSNQENNKCRKMAPAI